MKNADNMLDQLGSMKLSLDKYQFKMEQNRKQILVLESELRRHSYVTEYAKEAREAAKLALKESKKAEKQGDNLISRIQENLQTRADDLKSFSAEELGAIPRKISESQVSYKKRDQMSNRYHTYNITTDAVGTWSIR